LIPNESVRYELSCHQSKPLTKQLQINFIFHNSIRKLKPVDATTNPSLILAAVSDPKFADIVDNAIKSAQGLTVEEQVADATDRLAVAFGTEISKIVPGYVSTEVDARLSFDKEGTIAKARKIISLYEQKAQILRYFPYIGGNVLSIFLFRASAKIGSSSRLLQHGKESKQRKSWRPRAFVATSLCSSIFIRFDSAVLFDFGPHALRVISRSH
jgi:hypothetical protein